MKKIYIYVPKVRIGVKLGFHSCRYLLKSIIELLFKEAIGIFQNNDE